MFMTEDVIPTMKAGKYGNRRNAVYPVTVLAKDREGLENLYRLISMSYLDYFNIVPTIPKTVLAKNREGLLLGPAGETGELISALEKSKAQDVIEEIAGFYDFIEVRPSMCFMRGLDKQVSDLGEKLGKPVCATGDVHYLNKYEKRKRQMLLEGSRGRHFKAKEEDGEHLYFRTTREMLKKFEHLGKDIARKIVIENPNNIADIIERIEPKADKFYPEIKGAEEHIKKVCEENAEKMYGNPLPETIRKRLDTELDSIISNGNAVIYRIAEMLVNKATDDGYLVGFRGCIGASFAAYMCGITEINPLPAHYICPECQNLEWDDTGEYDCGQDMPERICPVCGEPYRKEGYNIPFETLLGIDGSREPDIDLNFAVEYQEKAKEHLKEIFGPEKVFDAGTVRTLGAKVSTGRYSEAVIIVPENHDIYEFTPIQHPVNEKAISTHLDYHELKKTLLKMDILGHDAPTLLKLLRDMTGVDPKTVPLTDEKAMSVFRGTDGLDIKLANYKTTHGCYGIHGFERAFARELTDVIKSGTIKELIRIGGLVYGTGVWNGNAKAVITSRDEIMNYLCSKGISREIAFDVMENVRMGRKLTEKHEHLMKEHDVPNWYIRSCSSIRYLFPRAHIASYILLSLREAYFKVYYPLEFYAAWFIVNREQFPMEIISMEIEEIENRIDELETEKGQDMLAEDENLKALKIVYEMRARGYEIAPSEIGFRFGNGKA